VTDSPRLITRSLVPAITDTRLRVVLLLAMVSAFVKSYVRRLKHPAHRLDDKGRVIAAMRTVSILGVRTVSSQDFVSLESTIVDRAFRPGVRCFRELECASEEPSFSHVPFEVAESPARVA